jgi:hypothetical protein
VHVSLVMPGRVDTEFARNALGEGTAAGVVGTGPPPQTVEEATATIVELIAHPRAELYTNPALAGIARRYYDDVGAFESTMRPAAATSGG